MEVEKDHFYEQMLMVNSKVKATEEFGKRFAEEKGGQEYTRKKIPGKLQDLNFPGNRILNSKI